MNHLVIHVGIALLLSGILSPLAAQKTERRAISVKPRVSHDELASKKKYMHENLKRESRKVPRKDLDRKRVPSNRSRTGIIERSTIISGAGGWTIVPKASVIHVPALYRERVNGVRAGKLLSWKEFHAKNRSWIRLYPITINQATGETPLRDEALTALRRTGVLTVATCKGGPISVKLSENESKEGNEKTNSLPSVKTREPGAKPPG